MAPPATPFFRDVRIFGESSRYAHERFMLDTLAERRATERLGLGARLRAFLRR